MFAAAGLPFTDEMERVPNSRKALRLGELARARGRFDALHERLFDAYWARGLDIGDDTVLLAEARAAGLPEDEARDVLEGDRYLDIVLGSTDAALQMGAGGVPAWAIDGRILVPGAQPHETFERIMERLMHKPIDGTRGGGAQGLHTAERDGAG